MLFVLKRALREKHALDAPLLPRTPLINKDLKGSNIDINRLFCIVVLYYLKNKNISQSENFMYFTRLTLYIYCITIQVHWVAWNP